MSSALARITEEDPILKVQRDPDTGETLLSGMGESHVEIACEKMRRNSPPISSTRRRACPTKTTTSTSSEYTHKKQSGGHGQYAKVTIAIEPLPRGSGRVRQQDRRRLRAAPVRPRR